MASGPRDAGHLQLSPFARRARRLASAAALLLAGCAAIGNEPGGAASRTSLPPTASLSARFCDPPKVQDAGQQDRLLRFAAVVRDRLEASGAESAVISRTGIDLDRFDVRFSHSGVAVREGGGVPWSVRQLYYACDERRPAVTGSSTCRGAGRPCGGP